MIASSFDVEQAQLHKVWGKYAGRVVSNADPEHMGRLQVRCDAVLGEATLWAMPCVPYAGKGVGFFFIPPPGAGIWVEFEGGDVSRPIWTGCFWSKGDVPAEATSPDIKLLATGEASLKLDDAACEVEIKNQQGATITWSRQVKTEAGKSTHVVGAAGVISESMIGKVAVNGAGVTVNNGAFKVT